MTYKRYRVLVADKIDTAGLDILKECSDTDVLTGLHENKICEIIGNYDALVIRSSTQVTAAIINATKQLCVIGRAGVGVDNVDVETATKQGVYVINSPLGNVVAAAEMTIGLILSLMRHIPQGNSSIRELKWDRNRFMGSQMNGKTIGIVGFGKVGRHVGRIASSAGMIVVFYDPNVSQTDFTDYKCERVEFFDLLSQSDIVTLHVPLVATTKHLINPVTIKLMKTTSRLVNTSRGGVVDEVAVSNALLNGDIAGAALDVFEKESKFPTDHPLLRCPNLLLTPHLGASTEEAQKSVAVDIAQQINIILKGGIPNTAVNAPSCLTNLSSNKSKDEQRRHAVLNCSRVFGTIAKQILIGKGDLLEILVTVGGAFSEHPLEPILLSVAMGVLNFSVSSRISYVNVREVSEELNTLLAISIDEDTEGIEVKLIYKDISNSIVGSVTAEGVPFLSSINNTATFLRCDRSMAYLFIRHSCNQDNTIGNIIRILGDRFESFHLKRAMTDDEAVLYVVLNSIEPLDNSIQSLLTELDFVVFKMIKCI